MNDITSRDTDTEAPGPMTGLTETDIHAQDAQAEGETPREEPAMNEAARTMLLALADLWACSVGGNLGIVHPVKKEAARQLRGALELIG